MKVLIPFLSMLFVYPLTLAQDHTENVSGPFQTVQQVTEECLICHEESGEEILHSKHWNWLISNTADSTQREKSGGKQNMINSFCIAVPDNLPRCASCHISYSWKDENFDFNSPENIDCLVCHDQTGTYIKSPIGSGMPDTTVDLLTVAQSVDKPTSKNCGTCHFNGGGGILIKHGALDKSLYNATEEIDFHMGGLSFGCSDCHETKKHQIAGGTASGENLVACENCHNADPHKKELLNQHYAAVACETCHIPTYAREEPAIIWWDWSKAGEDRESTKDEFGKDIYDKKKGEFIRAENVKPEYYWYNGTEKYYELGEKIENTKLLVLNRINGSISEPNSKISPFKVMKGKQPFDSVNKYLIIPKLYEEDGYFKTFNWVSASEIGMEEVNLVFSGSVYFIETKMYWPINHLVMSADNALKCTACHGKGGEGLLNWKSLGYPDDPIKKGGRVKNKLIKE